jgi:hypothetical protein
VVVTGHDYRCLQVAQGEDVVPGVAVGGDVDCLVGEALLVERFVRGVARTPALCKP